MASVGVSKEVIDAIPVALMRPFSAGGRAASCSMP
jgi:hypothetical protein